MGKNITKDGNNMVEINHDIVVNESQLGTFGIFGEQLRKALKLQIVDHEKIMGAVNNIVMENSGKEISGFSNITLSQKNGAVGIFNMPTQKDGSKTR